MVCVICRYISMSFSTVVMHTLSSPSGELGSYPTSMIGTTPMNMGAHILTPMGGPSAMRMGMQSLAPKSSMMLMIMGMGM